MSDYADRVARGVLWLDHMHDGWREKVNLETLSLQSGNNCVLAQVTGKYYWGAVASILGNGTGESNAEDMGFNARYRTLDAIRENYYSDLIDEIERDRLTDMEYAYLENEWREVLAA